MRRLINCVAIFSLVLSSFAVIADDELFYLEGEARPGSKFKMIEATSKIPFDKNYSELTESQKDLFRENYGDMPSADAPPFPKEGLHAIYLPIIKGHRKKPVESDIFAIAVISSEGKVVKVDVYKAPHKKNG